MIRDSVKITLLQWGFTEQRIHELITMLEATSILDSFKVFQKSIIPEENAR